MSKSPDNSQPDRPGPNNESPPAAAESTKENLQQPQDTYDARVFGAIANVLDETMAAKKPTGQATTVDEIATFGDYEKLRLIGRGGMGLVFRARHRDLNRTVALKMISGAYVTDDQVRRFQREAEAAASLDHPGIVAIHEYGVVEGQPYFTMNLVEGHSLADLVQEHPLDPQQAAAILVELAKAVEHAHAKNVIHRDIKPANVLIDEQGRPRLTDFGLARYSEGNESQLTGTGEVLGTPSYMPPEQGTADIEAIGPLSDVYSLGAVFYHLLTGRPPFWAESHHATLLQVLQNDPVPVRRLQSHVPRDLETICLKCLAKKPNGRYDSATSLREDLERFQSGRSIKARPLGTVGQLLRWSRRQPAVASLLALLILAITIGMASVLLLWRRAEQNRGRAERLGSLATNEASHARDAELRAKDNERRWRHLLYNSSIRMVQDAQQRGNHTLVRQLLEPFLTDAERRSDDEPDVRSFAWHRAWRQRRLREVSANKLPILNNNRRFRRFAISRDHQLLAIGSKESIQLRSTTTNSLVKEIATHWIGSLTFSPDGRWLAFVESESTTSANGARLAICDLSDYSIRRFSKSHAVGFGSPLAFADNGQIASYNGQFIGIWSVQDGDLLHQGFNPASSPGEETERVTRQQADGTKKQINLLHRHVPVVSMRFVAENQQLLIADSERGVFRWTLERKNPAPILDQAFVVRPYAEKNRVDAVVLSPDGQTLLVLEDEQVVLWDTNTQTESVRFKIDNYDAATATLPKFTAYGNRIIIAGNLSAELRQFDLDGKQVERFVGMPTPVLLYACRQGRPPGNHHSRRSFHRLENGVCSDSRRCGESRSDVRRSHSTTA